MITKEFRIDYKVAFHNGAVMIETDEYTEVLAVDKEDAKEVFKYYIKDFTDYKLPEVQIVKITEL